MMLTANHVIDEAAIKGEIGALLRNVPIMVGREIGPVEAGMALGVFVYWYLGFRALSSSERSNSIFNFLNDCRSCLHILYRRELRAACQHPFLNPCSNRTLRRKLRMFLAF